MRCLAHREREAVAVCTHCGRALCESCAQRSENGRLVCSLECANAIEQLDEFIASTRHKAIRTARITARFFYVTAAVFVVFAVYFYLDHLPQLAGFLGASAIGLIVGGIGYMRIAKRDTAVTG